MRITMARKGALPIALALLLTGCATSSINPNCPPPVPRLEWSPPLMAGFLFLVSLRLACSITSTHWSAVPDNHDR
jgi:uncharacterized lipoprotein YajG